MSPAVIVVAWIVIGAWVGGLIGASKGRTDEGVLWGVLLGVIGWIIVAVMPATPDKLAEQQLAVRDAVAQRQGRWGVDPYGRYSHRWYDGYRWTDWVSSNGQVYQELPTH